VLILQIKNARLTQRLENDGVIREAEIIVDVERSPIVVRRFQKLFQAVDFRNQRGNMFAPQRVAVCRLEEVFNFREFSVSHFSSHRNLARGILREIRIAESHALLRIRCWEAR